MKQSMFILFIFFLSFSHAQENPIEPAVNGDSAKVSMASFIGNIDSFIMANIRYPLAARENGIEERLILRFTVNTDSTISDIEVLSGKQDILIREAKRVIKLMNKRWIPASRNGVPYRMTCAIPILFRLE